MRAEVQRREYDILIYPYDDDEEEYGTYRLTIHTEAPGVFRMHITDSALHGIYDDDIYLADLRDSAVLTDPVNLRGILLDRPFDKVQKIYDQLEEIDDYDEYQCAVLASAVHFAYENISNNTETGINSWEG